MAATLESLPRRVEGMEGQPNPAVIGAILSLVFMFVMVGVLLQWLYYAYFESGEKQATWGRGTAGVACGTARQSAFRLGGLPGDFSK